MTKPVDRQQPYFAARPLGFLFAVLAFGFAAFIAPTSTLLPHEYAVCSASNHIYTVDNSNPNVECILIRGSRILDVGTLPEVQTRSTAQLGLIYTVIRTMTRLGELKVFHVKPGSIVVPGLTDAHAHVIEYGLTRQLPLIDATSIEGKPFYFCEKTQIERRQDVVDHVKHYINTHLDVHNDTSLWIQGMGWDQTKWAGGEFPTATDLNTDPLLRGRPILLYRIDGHAAWVSDRVLELIGPVPSTVEGGTIVRDVNGNPTGIFVDNAMSLIPRQPYSKSQMLEYFDLTMKDALEHGLTSIHDASTSPEMIEFFKGMAEEGKLPIRLYMMGFVPSYSYSDWIDRFYRLVDHGKHARLNLRSVKLFSDGALGSWGAALLKPYSDNPETSGLMLSSPENLAMLVEELWRDGWQVNIHAIGDRANNVVLDILEGMIEGKPRRVNVTQWRPRIEHAQIMTAEDLTRTGRLGVMTSVQPTHATSDMWYAETRLGPDRIKHAYAYQTLLQASPNNVLPLGSDFPVESINPLTGFYAAVSRLSTTGTSPHGSGGWFRDERLTRAQALKGMTLDAAYASFAEAELGSLVPGKKADFVVLDRDIMSVPLNEILKTKVQATIIDGRVEYGRL